MNFETYSKKIDVVSDAIDECYESGICVNVDAEDIMGLIYKTNPYSIHLVAEFCEENFDVIKNCLESTFCDYCCVGDEDKEVENLLKTARTTDDLKRIIRKRKGYGLHITKNHLVELVY